MANKKISALTAATTPLAGTEVLPIVQSGSTVKVAISDVTAGRTVAVKNLTTSLANSNDIVKLERTGSNPGSGFIFANDTNMFGVQDGTRYPFLVNQGAGTSSLVVDSSSNVNFGNGNLVQGTAAKGINFTANTGAAGKTSQLLNWYEEGTWTPTYYGAAGSAGSLAYAEQTGKYTRIGRQVTVTGTIILSNKGSWTGRVQIGGFPFTPTADQYTGQVELRNCTFTGDYVIMEIGRASTSFARFVIVSGSGANTQIDDTSTANNSGFLFTLTYMV